MQSRKVLLTFDLEEFDIPIEYGSAIGWEEQLAVGRQGMKALNEVLELQKIPVTIFTTAAYAQENKEELRLLAQQHEIASHTFHHSHFEDKDLLQSKLTLEEITGSTVYGLRMPRMKPVDMCSLKQAGYQYDSSINPTFVPGKYNNTHLPKTLYKDQQVYRFPCSVSPNFRIPLFWLTFKNFPYSIYKKLATDTLQQYGYLNLYFHPWEFTDISMYKLPGYVKKHSGNKLLYKLNRLINDLKREGTFDSMNNVLIEKIARGDQIQDFTQKA